MNNLPHGIARSIAWVPAAVALAGCTYLPSPHSPKFVDAVGSVTISTPLFSPFDSPPDSEDRLDFGDAKSEATIAARINTPNIAIETIRYSAIESSLRATVAGESITRGATTSQTVLNDVFTREQQLSEERSFETPGEAPPSAQLGTPAAVQAALESLLKRSTSEFQLPPDQVATLVAAHKIFMVNLEEYYNASGYTFDGAHRADWVPYKAHFTVTAEPGYYTRYNQYDAVVDLRLGGQHGHQDIRILTVTPLETAQTLNQLKAELTLLKSELEATGTGGPAAVNASIRSIDQLARRLEGLRTNKTLVVGYPKPNVCRIRFRPSVVATEEEQDLQPTSRVLTAMVLVRSQNTSNGEKALAIGSSALEPLANPAAAQRREELITKIQSLNEKVYTQFDELAAIEDAHRQEKESFALQVERDKAMRELAAAEDALFNARASLPYTAREMSYDQRGYFAPGLRDRSGDFSPARAYPGFGIPGFAWLLDKPTDRLWSSEDCPDGRFGGQGLRKWSSDPDSAYTASIPVWRGEFGRRLEIRESRGFYAFDSATPIGLSLETPRVQSGVDKAKKTLSSKSDALVAAKQTAAGAKSVVKSAEAALQAARSGGDADALAKARDDLASAKKADAEARVKLDGAKAAEDRAKTDLAGSEKALEEHLEELRSEWSLAASFASISVGVRVRAPIGYLDGDTRARAARVFARFHTEDSPYTNDWIPLGKGDLGATFTVDGVDLSNAIRIGKDGALTLGQVRGFVELALVDVVKHPYFSGESGAIIKRAVQDIVVEPAAKFVATPQPKKDDKPKTSSNDSKAIQIELEDLELKLTGSVPESKPTPTATPAKK